jgi:hypothetical protein
VHSLTTCLFEHIKMSQKGWHMVEGVQEDMGVISKGLC